jgi:apolipoprotein N-acyltransferase
MVKAFKIFGLLSLCIAVIEIILCFFGPIAFVQKPSLVIFPLLTLEGEFTQTEKRSVETYLEEEFAKTGSFAIVSKQVVDDYLLRENPSAEQLEQRTFDYTAGMQFARRLGLSRFVLGNLFRGDAGELQLSLALFDARNGEEIKRLKTISPAIVDFLNGKDSSGQDLAVAKSFSIESKGITITDIIILLIFVATGAVGLLSIFRGFIPNRVLELIWATALLFFIFAFLYAQNANMDYVQRFIASRGQIQLAQSTALEQFYAFLRFGPLLLLFGWFYVHTRVRKIIPAKITAGETRLSKAIARWALPWVLVSAVVYGFSFSSVLSLSGIPLLAWIALVPIFLVLLSVPRVRGAFYVVVFGVLQALIINSWHSTYKYTALFVLSATMFVQYLCFGLALVWVVSLSRKWGFITLPLAWVVFDYIRSQGFLAYPWGMAGASQYGFIPLIQLAGLAGVWGVSFVVILANSALAYTLAARSKAWTWFSRRGEITTEESDIKKTDGKTGVHIQIIIKKLVASLKKWPSYVPLIIACVVLLVSIVYGGIVMAIHDSEVAALAPERTASFLLIQQNTDPRKHDWQLNLQRLQALTKTGLDRLGERPDLIIWSEGAFMFNIPYWSASERAGTMWGEYVRNFLNYQKGLNNYLLMGTEDFRLKQGEEKPEASSSGTMSSQTAQSDGGAEKSGNANKESIGQEIDLTKMPLDYFNSSVMLAPDGRLSGFTTKCASSPLPNIFLSTKRHSAGSTQCLKNSTSRTGLPERNASFLNTPSSVSLRRSVSKTFSPTTSAVSCLRASTSSSTSAMTTGRSRRWKAASTRSTRCSAPWKTAGPCSGPRPRVIRLPSMPRGGLRRARPKPTARGSSSRACRLCRESRRSTRSGATGFPSSPSSSVSS